MREKYTQTLDKFPQHVCLECFKMIQQIDHFLIQAKSSAVTLHKILSEATVEIQQEGLCQENKDINKYFFSEVESVLLNNMQYSNEDAIKADPFNDEKINANSPESDGFSVDDDEWEVSSATSNWSEKNYKKSFKNTKNTAATTDDTKIDKTNDPFADDNKEGNELQKKRRRSRQEMDEYRRQRAKNSITFKRRPKGTKNKFRCEQCDHRFAYQMSLDVHIRKIHEGNPRPYLCEHCPKTYVALTGLTSHIQVEHSKERRTFICDFPNCNRKYSCQMGLQNHKRIKHTDPNKLNKFICEKCGDTFWKRSLLIYHRRAKHPTEEEKAKKTEVFECDICHNTLATKHSLKYHKEQQHSGNLKFKCDICGQRLAQKSSVEYHRLLHSTERIPCKDCDKQFVRDYDLRKHIRVAHMKLKPYKCSYCDLSFASNKTMKHHQYTHTGEKPYVCNICNKSYRQPTCLKNHLKTHEKLIQITSG